MARLAPCLLLSLLLLAVPALALRGAKSSQQGVLQRTASPSARVYIGDADTWLPTAFSAVASTIGVSVSSLQQVTVSSAFIGGKTTTSDVINAPFTAIYKLSGGGDGDYLMLWYETATTLCRMVSVQVSVTDNGSVQARITGARFVTQDQTASASIANAAWNRATAVNTAQSNDVIGYGVRGMQITVPKSALQNLYRPPFTYFVGGRDTWLPAPTSGATNAPLTGPLPSTSGVSITDLEYVHVVGGEMGGSLIGTDTVPLTAIYPFGTTTDTYICAYYDTDADTTRMTRVQLFLTANGAIQARTVSSKYVKGDQTSSSAVANAAWLAQKVGNLPAAKQSDSGVGILGLQVTILNPVYVGDANTWLPTAFSAAVSTNGNSASTVQQVTVFSGSMAGRTSSSGVINASFDSIYRLDGGGDGDYLCLWYEEATNLCRMVTVQLSVAADGSVQARTTGARFVMGDQTTSADLANDAWDRGTPTSQVATRNNMDGYGVRGLQVAVLPSI